jgi:hypothetical protein
LTANNGDTATANVLGHAKKLPYGLPFQLDGWQGRENNLGSPGKAWRLSALFVFRFS